ncbi:MAG TPA: TonB-dependent receptor [Sphingobacteriaceae bacterium]|nr:TonB-dependent receptor [Sphingobacteriaceae bacterium]
MKTAKLVLLFFSLVGFSPLFAQNQYIIKGIAVDTLANTKLINTSVSVLNAKDSTLVKFTRAITDGSFSITNLAAGKFILLVTYPGYADYVEDFKLDSANKEKDFKQLNLLLKENLLKEILIKGEAVAIKIKGDTTEFNAAAFKIEPNSKVEDLLKQLPGIQVDKDGKITAQGVTVNKVLVDGEEFFGDDPTLVTKNLRGDMVDKVQLFDKKSDQATFTGIDDGQKTKTLNIKLKEDKKNGFFGKIDAGATPDDFYQGQGMFNAFKAKKKFSAYATISNTGKTGLSWEENSKYGSASLETMEGGGVMFSGVGGDELESFSGRFEGQGIPLAHAGGFHYESKWNSDKQSVNANYKIGSLDVDGVRNTQTQNNLPAGIIKSNNDQSFDNYMFRQKLDATYQVKLDSTSNLKVSIDGTLKNSQSQNLYDAASSRGNNVLLNTSTRNLTNDGEQQLFNVNVFWNKKFKKVGRTVSLNLKQNSNENKSTGLLNSANSFYNHAGVLDSVQNIDQYKTNNSLNSVFNSNLAFTELLTKSLSVVVNYGFDRNNSNSDRESFNQSATGKYDLLDRVFSNDYSVNALANHFGTILNYKKDKTVINIGSKAYAVDFRQVDNYTGNTYKRNFLNLFPQASFQYNMSKQKSVRFNYNGYNSQPSINQIQPVRVNDDPLNVVLGNPDLNPSFNNHLSLSFNSYKILSDQYIYINGSYGFISNAIVNNIVTDSAGKNTYQAFNIVGKMPGNFSLYSNIRRKVNKEGLSVGLNLSARGNTYYNMINNIMNMTESYNFSGGVSTSQYKPKKYNFNIFIGPNYYRSQSSLQRQINNNGWGLNSRASFSVTLPGKVEITSEGNYEFRQKTQSFNQDFDRLIWNSSINKKFFKKENLMFSLSGNDLLNQNIGFSRSASSNFITQNSYTTIRRYFMFSAIWDFNKMGGGAPKP